jgi:hypothetical protein
MGQRLVTIASVIVVLTGAGSASATNLIVNGDFSAGNTGFSTGYTLTTMTPYLFQNGVHGIYAIEPAGSIAGSSQYGDWTNITTDPSGGNGNVFVADGATSPATVWSETVAVTSNTNYLFSYYGAEVSNPCCSNASFVPTIDGTNGPTLAATGSWQKSAFVWNSGSNTMATVSLNDTNLSGPFNDFAVDDFSLTSGVPEPVTWAMMLIGLSAIGGAARFGRGRAVVGI